MTITVCPECDSPHIESVVAGGFGARSVTHAYRCNDCGARFDTACERPAHHTGGEESRHGLAKTLAETDADDLVTDGGTVTACPECDSAKLQTRGSLSEVNYVCQRCGARFKRAVERERQHPNPPKRGPAKRLFEAGGVE